MVVATLLAQGALEEAVTSATVTSRTPVTYDPFLPGRSVERVVGEALLGTGATRDLERRRQAVDRCRPPGGRA